MKLLGGNIWQNYQQKFNKSASVNNKFLTWPNAITLLRLPLAGWITVQIYLGKFIFALALAVFFFILDLVDGYLARKLNQTTHLGKILDATVDKIAVLAIFTALYS